MKNVHQNVHHYVKSSGENNESASICAFYL